MAGVSVELRNEEALERILDRALNPPLDDIAEAAGAALLNRIRSRFLQTRDPDGNLWPESRAAREGTGRSPRRRLGGATLFDTGALFNSIQLINDGPGARRIGTDVAYGKFHQEGTATLPQRMFLGFGVDDVNLAGEIAAAVMARHLGT